MINNHARFPSVTLLITHYNRTVSLERLLRKFENNAITFGEIVVSDDGSSPENQEALRSLSGIFRFRLLLSTTNKGLGHNLNRGQDAVRTPYTLYVQEDFLPEEKFTEILNESVALLDRDKDLDLVRYFANFEFPYFRPFNAHFNQLFAPTFGRDYHKIYVYSDNPHLRRSSFLQKFGRYRENIPGDRTEYYMCISFIRRKGKAILYQQIHGLFTHVNFPAEPSTMSRKGWRYRGGPLLDLAKRIYRQIRYNVDLHFVQVLLSSLALLLSPGETGYLPS